MMGASKHYFVKVASTLVLEPSRTCSAQLWAYIIKVHTITIYIDSFNVSTHHLLIAYLRHDDTFSSAVLAAAATAVVLLLGKTQLTSNSLL